MWWSGALQATLLLCYIYVDHLFGTLGTQAGEPKSAQVLQHTAVHFTMEKQSIPMSMILKIYSKILYLTVVKAHN